MTVEMTAEKADRIIMFTADNDICLGCRHWFPGS